MTLSFVYIFYTHSLKDILCNIFSNFVHESKFHDVRFFRWDHHSGTQKVSSLGAFWILGLDLGILHLYQVYDHHQDTNEFEGREENIIELKVKWTRLKS